MIDDMLEKKGYHLVEVVSSYDKAKALAIMYRSKGYYARFVTYTTNAIGYHDYGVWIKQKKLRRK